MIFTYASSEYPSVAHGAIKIFLWSVICYRGDDSCDRCEIYHNVIFPFMFWKKLTPRPFLFAFSPLITSLWFITILFIHLSLSLFLSHVILCSHPDSIPVFLIVQGLGVSIVTGLMGVTNVQRNRGEVWLDGGISGRMALVLLPVTWLISVVCPRGSNTQPSI